MTWLVWDEPNWLMSLNFWKVKFSWFCLRFAFCDIYRQCLWETNEGANLFPKRRTKRSIGTKALQMVLTQQHLQVVMKVHPKTERENIFRGLKGEKWWSIYVSLHFEILFFKRKDNELWLLIPVRGKHGVAGFSCLY